MEILINRNLIFAENQHLVTKRLLLRPITLEDAEDMYEYSSDEETVTYVFPVHQSLADTRKNIAEFFIAAPLGKYGIILKKTDKLIGTIDLRVIEKDNIAELGYALNKEFWGNGYMAEAAEVIMELGFERLDLMRIFAVHDQDNPNSGRVMEKVGMKKEGTIPNARLWKGKIVTDVMRGITVDDWQESKNHR